MSSCRKMGVEPVDASCFCAPCERDKVRIEDNISAKTELDKYFRGPLCHHDALTLGTWIARGEAGPAPSDCVRLGGLLTAWYENYSDSTVVKRQYYNPHLDHGRLDTCFQVSALMRHRHLPPRMQKWFTYIPPTEPYFPMGAIYSKPEYGRSTFCCQFEDGKYFYWSDIRENLRRCQRQCRLTQLYYLQDFLRGTFPMPRHEPWKFGMETPMAKKGVGVSTSERFSFLSVDEVDEGGKKGSMDEDGKKGCMDDGGEREAGVPENIIVVVPPTAVKEAATASDGAPSRGVYDAVAAAGKRQ